jgi:hypothetical protein
VLPSPANNKNTIAPNRAAVGHQDEIVMRSQGTPDGDVIPAANVWNLQDRAAIGDDEFVRRPSRIADGEKFQFSSVSVQF